MVTSLNTAIKRAFDTLQCDSSRPEIVCCGATTIRLVYSTLKFGKSGEKIPSTEVEYIAFHDVRLLPELVSTLEKMNPTEALVFRKVANGHLQALLLKRNYSTLTGENGFWRPTKKGEAKPSLEIPEGHFT
jgi:hypothetical protein